MTERVSTSGRVLGLFFELLTCERPRTKARLRRLNGYSELSDAAFESAFQRDKTALREAGVVLDLVGGAAESYRVSDDSFATGARPLDDTDVALIHMAIRAWQPGGPDEGLVGPKLAALVDDGRGAPTPRLTIGLEGAQSLAALVTAIEDRRIVSFSYTSANGTFARAVEPWRIVLRGRALYLWGRDLDREDERVFRLSRIRSEVEFLGDAGDAGAVPPIDEDPFDRLLVAPTLAVREDRELAIRAFLTDGTEEGEAGWRIVHGERDERGTWIDRVLAEGEDVIVLEPVDLRDEVRARLEAAAQWGRDRA